MAPSGNNAVPQRFRQRRPSPTFNDLTVSSATTEHWENLLDRRKKCKDRNLKVITFFLCLCNVSGSKMNKLYLPNLLESILPLFPDQI